MNKFIFLTFFLFSYLSNAKVNDGEWSICYKNSRDFMAIESTIYKGKKRFDIYLVSESTNCERAINKPVYLIISEFEIATLDKGLIKSSYKKSQIAIFNEDLAKENKDLKICKAKINEIFSNPQCLFDLSKEFQVWGDEFKKNDGKVYRLEMYGDKSIFQNFTVNQYHLFKTNIYDK